MNDWDSWCCYVAESGYELVFLCGCKGVMDILVDFKEASREPTHQLPKSRKTHTLPYPSENKYPPNPTPLITNIRPNIFRYHLEKGHY